MSLGGGGGKWRWREGGGVKTSAFNDDDDDGGFQCLACIDLEANDLSVQGFIHACFPDIKSFQPRFSLSLRSRYIGSVQ